MGEQSEMMLDGTLCMTCGEFVGECAGYPVECRGCHAAGGKVTTPPDMRPAKSTAYKARRKRQKQRRNARKREKKAQFPRTRRESAGELEPEYWVNENDGSVNQTNEHGSAEMDECEVVKLLNTLTAENRAQASRTCANCKFNIEGSGDSESIWCGLFDQRFPLAIGGCNRFEVK